MEYAMVDATIVKVHRHGQGAKGGLRARPLVVRFQLLPGHRFDTVGVAPLIEGWMGDIVLKIKATRDGLSR